jgi:hypothetical protein
MPGIEHHVLDADDLLAFVRCDGVPDGHVLGVQAQFVRTRQRVVLGERIRECRDRLVQ